MFNLDNVRTLHLEITSHCNAACSACNRYLNDQLNPNLTLGELGVKQISAILTTAFVQQLDKMFMCGNHGDPAAGKHTIEVFEWFRKNNTKIVLGMNTNGGIKTEQWWAQLGQVLSNESDYVVFSIDGLEDTNHIYRRNVSWHRLMRNAQAFIDNGGQAHWEMLIFKHNEHQVEQARELSAAMGFKHFRNKISRREKTWKNKFLEMPKNYSVNFHSNPNEIDCAALRDRSIYLDYRGKLLPCCWLGIDAINNKVDYALETFTPSLSNKTCVKSCGVTDKSNYEKQWIN